MPHCPHSALARPIWRRASALAPASSTPNGSEPLGRSRTTMRRSAPHPGKRTNGARSWSPHAERQEPPAGDVTVSAPPISPRIDRPLTSGWFWSMSSPTVRINEVARQLGASPPGQGTSVICRELVDFARPAGCWRRSRSAGGRSPGLPTTTKRTASGSSNEEPTAVSSPPSGGVRWIDAFDRWVSSRLPAESSATMAISVLARARAGAEASAASNEPIALARPPRLKLVTRRCRAEVRQLLIRLTRPIPIGLAGRWTLRVPSLAHTCHPPQRSPAHPRLRC